jgi:2-polyprenyl-3-methyl-5-hydroxy-6-metoxy-1,4-benzoquinol methylase
MFADNDYRELIYEKYASCFQGYKPDFDIAADKRWGQAYKSFLRGWLPERKDAAILEVACGSGKLLRFLKEQGYTDIAGVDISPEQVSLAKQVTENVVEDNVLDFLESTEKRYDLIIGLDIIEHFTKDEALHFLQASSKALKSGGRIIIQTPNADSPWGGTIRYGDFTHEICFNPNALRNLLNLLGFQHIEAREGGPVVHGVVSFVRYVIWQLIRLILKIWNLAETGSAGSNVYTRVFLISGIKENS